LCPLGKELKGITFTFEWLDWYQQVAARLKTEKFPLLSHGRGT